jgi:hypothetical protein
MLFKYLTKPKSSEKKNARNEPARQIIMRRLIFFFFIYDVVQAVLFYNTHNSKYRNDSATPTLFIFWKPFNIILMRAINVVPKNTQSRMQISQRILPTFLSVKKFTQPKLKNNNIFKTWARIKKFIGISVSSKRKIRVAEKIKIITKKSLLKSLMFIIKKKPKIPRYNKFVKYRVKNQINKNKSLFNLQNTTIRPKLNPRSLISTTQQKLYNLLLIVRKLKFKRPPKHLECTLLLSKPSNYYRFKLLHYSLINNNNIEAWSTKTYIYNNRSKEKYFRVCNPIKINNQWYVTTKQLIDTKPAQILYSILKATPARTHSPNHNVINFKKKLFSKMFFFYSQYKIFNYFCHSGFLKNSGLLNITVPARNSDALFKGTLSYHNFINFRTTLLNECGAVNLNNFYPIIFFNSKNLIRVYNRYIYSLYRGISKSTVLYNHFLLTFLENYIKQKIWLRYDARNHSNFNFNTKQHFLSNLSLVKSNLMSTYLNRLVPIYDLVEIIIIMFSTRDLQIFLYFVKNCLERAHFKKHKKILSIIFDTFKKNEQVLYQTKSRGFFFDIRGKVGVSGNAKKRHLMFSIGKITTTSQNFRSHWQQINVWTPTGQMGITCYIMY